MSTFLPLNRVDEKCEFEVLVSSLNETELYTVEAVSIPSAITRALAQFNSTHKEAATGVECHALKAELTGPVYR